MPTPQPRHRSKERRKNRGFRDVTLKVLDERSAAERKGRGQYFTPREVRQRLLDRLDLAPGMRVLDPGVGTGEFLLDVLERVPTARVYGFDIDAELVRVCRKQGLDNVTERDFLRAPPDSKYDLVIGNPPYYEVRADAELRECYADVIHGRPNVFSMFVKGGLELLEEGGRLAFVVPPSMNNGRFFLALRRFILTVATIEWMEVLGGATRFEGANQTVMLIVLRKGRNREEDRYVFRAELGEVEPIPIFMTESARLRALLDGQHTLHSLGYRIQTGRCVWNQRKNDLRRRIEPGVVPLIWATNIRSGELVLDEDHATRPQYVLEPSPDIGPALVVNRVIGAPGRGGVRVALIPKGMRFVAENHVNVVRRDVPLRSDRGDGLDRRVLAGLQSDRALEAVRAITGNTQLSSRELCYLVPVMPVE